MSQNHLNDLVDHYYWNYIINIISITPRPGLLHHGRGTLRRRLAGLGPQRDLRAVAEERPERTQRGPTRGTRGTGGRWLGKFGISILDNASP
jgi:hypothetical protein